MHHSFDTELADKYGMKGAILIHHFEHWIRKNKKKGVNQKEGRTWTYQTQEDIKAHFSYMSIETIKYSIEKLIEKGVLIRKNFNKSPIDKTWWYAFADEKKWLGEKYADSKNVSDTENSASTRKIPAPIPNTKSPNTSSSMKSNDYEKTMPPFQGRIKETGNGKTKFPLKKDQMSVFQNLKEAHLGAPESTFMIWIRIYGVKAVEEALGTLKREIQNGTIIRNRAGFIRTVLDGKIKKISSVAEENLQFVNDYLTVNPWNSLEIYKHHVFDSISRKDLSLDMNPQIFIRLFASLHETSERLSE